MIFLQNIPVVIITVSLLTCTGSMEEKEFRGLILSDTSVSLWGKVADFTPECNHWRLRARVSVPALQELTVCFSLKLKVLASSPWTAFMYLHPVGQYAELGLGGKGGRLVVWLFGTEWSTREVNLNLSQWYQLCLTWTQATVQPTLYINGEAEDVAAAHRADGPPSTSSSCCKLAPNGTLTLGAAHKLVNRSVEVLPFTGLSGRISLFRLWGREWSKEEVTSLKCIEGDLVTWSSDDWDTQACAPVHDSSLRCEWSFYEVKLMFAIFWSDGSHTELHTAIKIAQQWLRDVLPGSIYLHKVSVFEVSSSRTGERFVKANTTVRWVPTYDRFNCRIYATVVPGLDVAVVQSRMHLYLNGHYHPAGLLLLVADDSVRTTAVESFAATTISPTSVVTKPSPPTSPTTVAPDGPATTTASSTAAVSSTFTTRAANVSDLYFEVKVNVSITGDSDTEETLSTWVNSSLPAGVMIVLDLRLLPKPPGRYRNPKSDLPTSDLVSAHAVSRASCVFQIRVTTSLSDSQEMEEQIRDLLLMPYNNGSISIATEDIQIIRIFVVNCRAETRMTKKGVFRWPVTAGGRNATQPCPKNPPAYATRHCKLSPTTHWLMPDLDHCSLLVESIPDLDRVQVTAENAPDVVVMIQGLLRNQSALNYDELVTVLDKLEDVVNLSVVTPNMGQAVIDIISEIMRSDSDLLPFTNTILNITEAVGNTMVGYQSTYTLVAPAIAISVVDVGPGQFDSLTFSVSSDPTGMKPEVFINRSPPNGTVAFISLPSVLRHSFPQNRRSPALPRVTFQFFGLPMLFQSSQKEQVLNTYVVSASVTNASSPIQDLAEDVKITLHHLTPNTLHRDVQCVYWNFNENNGSGGWDDRGCRRYNTTPDYTTCLCDHLTHFGVLLDVSRTLVDEANEQILTIITYVGCGVSSLFLGVTFLTYTAFEKLRRDYPSQILINLSLALLGLNLAFLVNSWLSSWGLRGLCVAVAVALHYFLLASFTWMGLEAVHMYFALVKVFNVYVPSYILKFCVLGWGIPLVICSLVLIVNSEAYGGHLYSGAQTLDNSDNFCWIQDHVTFYVSVVAVAVLIFLFNVAVFVVVLIQIRHMRANSPAGTRSGLMQELRGVASLTLLLGLTWTFGFFTWGPARMFLLYLFSVLNSLQGLFIFLFHCLMKENVRKQWRIHLCFGRFRLDEYSERSNSASVGAMAKPKSNIQSVPSVRSVKSSSTDSTSASSGSCHRDTSCRRPNLGLLVNSLALPRAQRSSSGAAALPSHRGIHQPPGWRNHLLGQQEQR